VTTILPIFLSIHLAASAAVLGFIEGVSDGLSSFSKLVGGYGSDRAGKRKPFLTSGYGLTGILMPMIGLSTSWLHVLFLRAGGWFGRGIRAAPRDALLACSTPEGALGKTFGFHRTMDTLGAILGSALALALLPYLQYRQILFLALLPGMASFLIVLTLVKDLRPSMGEPPDMGGSVRSFRGSLKQLPQDFARFLLSVGVFGFANFANIMFTLRAQEILSARLGAAQGSVLAVALYVLLNIVYAGASFPIGFLTDRGNKQIILAVGYVVFSFACLLLSLDPTDIGLLGFVFGLVGLHSAIVETIEPAYAADLLPRKVVGTGYGVLQTVNGLGDFASSAIVGMLWVSISPKAAFIYSATLSLMASAILLWTMYTSKYDKSRHR